MNEIKGRMNIRLDTARAIRRNKPERLQGKQLTERRCVGAAEDLSSSHGSEEVRHFAAKTGSGNREKGMSWRGWLFFFFFKVNHSHSKSINYVKFWGNGLL